MEKTNSNNLTRSITYGKEKQRIVADLAQRMWDASPYKVRIHTTLNRREALADADFVTTQFRVGLLEARIKDERIPDLHGMLGQETNGAGGMMKAFRTIPVIGKSFAQMHGLSISPIPVEWSRKPPSNSLGGKRPSDFATCRE